MLDVLRRVLPLAGAVNRVVRTLAVVGLAAGAAIVLAVLAVVGVPHSLGDVVLIVVIAALLAAPGVVLLVFFFAVNELLGLPTRLRELPRTGREHLNAIARLQREATAGDGARWTAPLTLWRLLDFLRSSSWILRPYAPVVAVFSPPLLLAVALSVLATLLLVPAALIALLVAAFA